MGVHAHGYFSFRKKQAVDAKGEHMGIFKDLMWYFKLEKKRYLIGVCLLIAVSLVILVPPRVVGIVVDGIQEGSLTKGELAKWVLVIFAVAISSYVFRYVWRLM